MDIANSFNYTHTIQHYCHLQPWHVLVFDTRATALRAAATSTRHENKQRGKPSKTGLPKKICKAKIFWEEEPQRSKTGGLRKQAVQKRSLRRRRRGGAEPSPLNRLGSAAAFPPCDPFSSLVLPFRLPLEFCLFRQA